MDNDRFNPRPPRPEPLIRKGKDPYIEPPIKDYSHLLRGEPPKRVQSRRRSRKIIMAIIIIILIAAAGLIGYTHFLHHPPKPKSTTQTNGQNSPAKTTNQTTATTSYTSSNFNVNLKYPKDWTVTNDTASSLTITSAARPLKNTTGQTVSGKIVLIMAPQGQLPGAFGSGDATAVLNSQQVSYVQPTANQRAQTYVSFVQYSSATITGELDGIYVTGNNGYQKTQTIPRADITNLNPLVTVTFGQCSGSNCSTLQGLNLQSSDWSDPALSTPILNVIKSFAFQ